jgi:hypothetical protein
VSDLGVDATPDTFIKLLFGALPADSTLTIAPDGTLSLHLQYIPVTQLDVSGDFTLTQTAKQVPSAVSTFVFRMADHVATTAGESRGPLLRGPPVDVVSSLSRLHLSSFPVTSSSRALGHAHVTRASRHSPLTAPRQRRMQTWRQRSRACKVKWQSFARVVEAGPMSRVRDCATHDFPPASVTVAFV